MDMYELGGMSQVRAHDLMMYCIVTPKVDVLHLDPILFLLDLCLHVQYIELLVTCLVGTRPLL